MPVQIKETERRNSREREREWEGGVGGGVGGGEEGGGGLGVDTEPLFLESTFLEISPKTGASTFGVEGLGVEG